MVIWRESGGRLGYLLVQEWAVLLLSLALAAVRKFMVTKLQWLTLLRQSQFKLHLNFTAAAEGHGQDLSAAWTNDENFQGLERYLCAKNY